jgi:hypothetical protein
MDNLEFTKLIHVPTTTPTILTPDAGYQKEARYGWDKFETRSQLKN